ncbi:MAG: dihydrofolate reductase family protein, partial [Deltaproteobacteria bacterium]|nr:dihydrofolate reductase family protein [Deltaproteobacteria bacterium]
TVIATTAAGDKAKKSKLTAMGVDVIVVGRTAENRVDLKALFGELGKRGISSVFVEGGAGIITSLIRERLPHRMFVITAPRIIGKGIEAVGDMGIKAMDDSIQVTVNRVFRKGDDVVCDASFLK